jgi:hypothetical protein
VRIWGRFGTDLFNGRRHGNIAMGWIATEPEAGRSQTRIGVQIVLDTAAACATRLCSFRQYVHDAQHQRRANYDHQRRQDESH